MSAERGHRALEDAIAADDDVAIATITAAELLVGLELAGARHLARREAFVEEVLAIGPPAGHRTSTWRGAGTG